MNNTVINLGCSWTYGYGLKSNETYPSFLQKLFSNYKFINAGHCGADIDYAIFSGCKLIKEYNPKVVIFQLTSFDRATLGTDGFKNFLKNNMSITCNSNIYYDDSDKNNCRVIGINDSVKTKYTNGSYVASKKDKREELLNSNMNNVNDKKYKNFVDVFYENIVYSNYEVDKKINNLYLFKKYLELMHIKSLWFFWLPPVNDNFFKDFFKECQFIETSVVEWLREYYPQDSFYIDKGYHLSSKGNEILAKEYITPNLKFLL